jgi:hypothetical protein
MLESSNLAKTPPPGQGNLLEQCRTVWQQIDAFFGPAKAAEHEQGVITSTLALSLIQKQALKLASELSRKLSAWLQGTVEDPRRRLPGAEALAQAFLQKLRLTEARALEFLSDGKKSIAHLRSLFAAGNFTGRTANTSWFPRGKRPANAKSPADILHAYATHRLKLVIVQDMTTVYAAVDRKTSEFLQEVTICRQKLRVLSEKFSAQASTKHKQAGASQACKNGRAPLPGHIELLPGGAKTFAHGVKEVLEGYDSLKIQELDQAFQESCLQPCGGLWKILTAQEDLGDQLREQLHKHLGEAVLKSLNDIDVPSLFLRAHPGYDDGRQALSDVIEAPPARLTTAKGWRHLIAAIPAGEDGDTIRELLHLAVPNVTSNAVRTGSNILICQEIGHLSAGRAAADIIGKDDAVKEVAPRLMTRIDVNWLPLEDDG